jgi:hypothetical protein
LTSLIGWNSFFIIVALALGYSGSAFFLLGFASLHGILQILIFKSLFNPLKIYQRFIYGVIWGGVIGGAQMAAQLFLHPFFTPHPIAWLLNGIYMGAAIGGILVYFHQDDRKIESELGTGEGAGNYGRDAHWLEPFGFGAICYLIVFIPKTIDLGIFIVVVGAWVGVISAAGSHFSPDGLKKSVGAIFLFSIIGGGMGLASGLLFRQFAFNLYASPLLIGAGSGALTFLVTILRGRGLALKEHGLKDA